MKRSAADMAGSKQRAVWRGLMVVFAIRRWVE
jgi:hypothetical protein